MGDGVLVLAEAPALGLRPIVVVNKFDKPDQRALEVQEMFDLFAALDASDEQLDFPTLPASAKQDWASAFPDRSAQDMDALLELILEHVPRRRSIPSASSTQGVGPDGTQLADECESLLWGFVNMLDSQTQRLDRAADKLLPGLRDLQRELELVTDRAQNLTDRRDAFEQMRDAAAGAWPPSMRWRAR